MLENGATQRKRGWRKKYIIITKTTQHRSSEDYVNRENQTTVTPEKQNRKKRKVNKLMKTTIDEYATEQTEEPGASTREGGVGGN